VNDVFYAIWKEAVVVLIEAL